MSSADPLPARIAFLGLGTMGRPMAARLLARGFPLTVWNRTGARAEELARGGAEVASVPAEAVRGARTVFTMLADPAAVDAVFSGSAGVIAGLAPGTLVCDLSTVDPETSRRTELPVRERGGRFIDAPVYGSRKPAEDGSLVVLAGGEAGDVERARPLFDVLARKVFHAGPVGAGSALKLAINLVGPHVLTGVALGLALARAQGLDGGQFLEALGSGAFTSPLVELKGRAMLARAYAPTFSVALMARYFSG